MLGIDWKKVFAQSFPERGATQQELRDLVSTISMPLSETEIQAITASQRNPFPVTHPLHTAYKPFDPRQWRLPWRSLPLSYLDFLEWSNGGEFVQGARQFGFFSTAELRNFLLDYSVPRYMPGALPIAFDGGGCFYLFDMRNNPVDGEYPVLFAAAGNLDYSDAVPVAESFLEACTGTTDPSDN